jgi:excisionase family DNA binding protein
MASSSGTPVVVPPCGTTGRRRERDQHYDAAVSLAGDDWMSVPQTAKLLGLQLHTVRMLIDRGELPAEFVLPYPGPKSRRRAIRLRRQDVYDYIKRSRVKPGELRGLYAVVSGGR